MKIIYYDDKGKITSSSINLPVDTSKQYIESEIEINSSLSRDFYVKNKELINKGEKPTERSVFNYEIETWIEPEYSVFEIEIKWLELKLERNLLLQSSDWTQLPDAPTSNVEDWKTYRTELRDLPSTTTNPFNVVWPTKPS